MPAIHWKQGSFDGGAKPVISGLSRELCPTFEQEALTYNVRSNILTVNRGYYKSWTSSLDFRTDGRMLRYAHFGRQPTYVQI